MQGKTHRDRNELVPVGLGGIGLLILIVLTGCAKTQPIYPSYDDLIQHRFYAYVLPDAETQQRGWNEAISIWDYDFHCQYYEDANNLYIVYKDEAGHTKLKLVIGHGSEAWDRRRQTTEVPLSTRWAAKGKAIFYDTSDGTVAMMFEDVVGIPVQVWSDFAITETVSLVNELEYVGPSLETMTDPWKNCK